MMITQPPSLTELADIESILLRALLRGPPAAPPRWDMLSMSSGAEKTGTCRPSLRAASSDMRAA